MIKTLILIITTAVADTNNSTPSTPTTPSSFFGGSFFSSVTSSVNSLSQTIQTKGIPEFNKRLNELQQRARDIPNQIATLQGDLESERALFVQNKKSDEKNGIFHQSRGSGIDIYISCWKQRLTHIYIYIYIK